MLQPLHNAPVDISNRIVGTKLEPPFSQDQGAPPNRIRENKTITSICYYYLQ